MTVLAHLDAVCLKTPTDFPQSFGTAKQRLETSLSLLVCGIWLQFVMFTLVLVMHSCFCTVVSREERS